MKPEPPTWDPGDRLAMQVAQRVYLGSSEPLNTEGIPAPDLVRLLQKHVLLGHVDSLSEAFALDAAGQALLTSYSRSLRVSAWQRVRFLKIVRDALDSVGVPGVFFKGVVMSQLIWGRSNARGAGDIDVLVPADACDAAMQALLAVGYRPPANMADLRPRRLDRVAQHGIALRLANTEVDVHYRLDQIQSVLALGFEEVLQRSQQIELANESFRTFDDELTLAVLAVNGGRDLWCKWGQVLDFATLNRRVALSAERAEALGIGYRYEVGQAVAELLGAPRQTSLSRRSRQLAGDVAARHARGEPADPVRARLQQWGEAIWKVQSVPTLDSYRWAALQVLWLGDEPGRGRDDGIREDVGLLVRRLMRAGNRPVMEPAAHLGDLVDGVRRGELDTAAFATLERFMVADALTAEDVAVMTMLAPLMARDLPDHAFTGRAVGMRRRARVRRALSEALLTAARQQGADGFLLGDLGAARTFYKDPDQRVVGASTLVLPGLSRQQAWTLARAAADEADQVLDGARWPVLERHGVRLAVHHSLGLAFDFPRVRAAVDDGPEWVMYDSLVRSALGAPKIQWYADAVWGQDLVDWGRVWEIAGIAGWYDPVARACAVLRARLGWEVPLRLGMDRLVDSGYFSRSQVRPVRLSWLALRLARHHLPSG